MHAWFLQASMVGGGGGGGGGTATDPPCKFLLLRDSNAARSRSER